MRRRPLNPKPVLFTRLPHQRWPDHQSFADIARRGERCIFHCSCRSGITIRADFSKLPWRRYHNYPSSTLFACPSCGASVRMSLLDGPGMPGDRANDQGRYGQ